MRKNVLADHRRLASCAMHARGSASDHRQSPDRMSSSGDLVLPDGRSTVMHNCKLMTSPADTRDPIFVHRGSAKRPSYGARRGASPANDRRPATWRPLVRDRLRDRL